MLKLIFRDDSNNNSCHYCHWSSLKEDFLIPRTEAPSLCKFMIMAHQLYSEITKIFWSIRDGLEYCVFQGKRQNLREQSFTTVTDTEQIEKNK